MAQSTAGEQDAPAGQSASKPNTALVEVVGKVGRLAAESGRSDLATRLAQTQERLQDPHIRVIIVGEFKQGKSKLVNALVNAPACPVDDDIATTVPTTVGYATEPSATVLLQPADGEGAASIQREQIPLESLADYVTGPHSHEDGRRVVSAEVLLPRELLRSGLRLIDSPGVGGLDSANALATLSALSTAHAVILVSDASQEYTEPEMQFLRHAMRISPNVAAVLAKTDLYPEWREIERIDRGHLGKIGDVPIFAVSSDLRLLAADTRDTQLNDESGFPALVTHLRTAILERAETVHQRSAIHDLVSVVDQLMITLRSELNAIIDPADSPRLIAELEEAKARADQFRGRSARWQLTLSDGISDLISDLEHDLRDRLRHVQREAEASIEEADPGPIWDQIVEWLNQRVSAAVQETFVWTDERAKWLAEQVAELFLDGEQNIPEINVGSIEGVLDPIDALGDLDPGHMHAIERIYIGMRGSYGGVLMVGLATGLLGLPLLNPLSLLVGVLVGRRAYREDTRARLLRRQNEAKIMIRKHIDEVTFQAGKQLKDRLRLVQRIGRDHFGALAEELHRSFTEAIAAVKKPQTALGADRELRVRQLRNQLRNLQILRDQIAPRPVAAATPAVQAAPLQNQVAR